jgi:hypothetical protein
MESLVRIIRPENFEQEVVAEKKPFLLLCMPRDEEFPKQLKVIEDVATKCSEGIKVGLLAEEFIEAFRKRYSIVGTPTFLILVEGEERSRMLGLADPKMLTDLISNFQQVLPR